MSSGQQDSNNTAAAAAYYQMWQQYQQQSGSATSGTSTSTTSTGPPGPPANSSAQDYAQWWQMYSQWYQNYVSSIGGESSGNSQTNTASTNSASNMAAQAAQWAQWGQQSQHQNQGNWGQTGGWGNQQNNAGYWGSSSAGMSSDGSYWGQGGYGEGYNQSGYGSNYGQMGYGQNRGSWAPSQRGGGGAYRRGGSGDRSGRSDSKKRGWADNSCSTDNSDYWGVKKQRTESWDRYSKDRFGENRDRSSDRFGKSSGGDRAFGFGGNRSDRKDDRSHYRTSSSARRGEIKSLLDLDVKAPTSARGRRDSDREDRPRDRYGSSRRDDKYSSDDRYGSMDRDRGRDRRRRERTPERRERNRPEFSSPRRHESDSDVSHNRRGNTALLKQKLRKLEMLICDAIKEKRDTGKCIELEKYMEELTLQKASAEGKICNDEATKKIAEEIKADKIGDDKNVEHPGEPDTKESESEGPAEPGTEDTNKAGTEGTDKPGTDGTDETGTDGTDKPETEGTNLPETEGTDQPETEGTDKPETAGCGEGMEAEEPKPEQEDETAKTSDTITEEKNCEDEGDKMESVQTEKPVEASRDAESTIPDSEMIDDSIQKEVEDESEVEEIEEDEEQESTIQQSHEEGGTFTNSMVETLSLVQKREQSTRKHKPIPFTVEECQHLVTMFLKKIHLETMIVLTDFVHDGTPMVLCELYVQEYCLGTGESRSHKIAVQRAFYTIVDFFRKSPSIKLLYFKRTTRSILEEIKHELLVKGSEDAELMKSLDLPPATDTVIPANTTDDLPVAKPEEYGNIVVLVHPERNDQDPLNVIYQLAEFNNKEVKFLYKEVTRRRRAETKCALYFDNHLMIVTFDEGQACARHRASKTLLRKLYERHWSLVSKPFDLGKKVFDMWKDGVFEGMKALEYDPIEDERLEQEREKEKQIEREKRSTRDHERQDRRTGSRWDDKKDRDKNRDSDRGRGRDSERHDRSTRDSDRRDRDSDRRDRNSDRRDRDRRDRSESDRRDRSDRRGDRDKGHRSDSKEKGERKVDETVDKKDDGDADKLNETDSKSMEEKEINSEVKSEEMQAVESKQMETLDTEKIMPEVKPQEEMEIKPDNMEQAKLIEETDQGSEMKVEDNAEDVEIKQEDNIEKVDIEQKDEAETKRKDESLMEEIQGKLNAVDEQQGESEKMVVEETKVDESETKPEEPLEEAPVTRVLRRSSRRSGGTPDKKAKTETSGGLRRSGRRGKKEEPKEEPKVDEEIKPDEVKPGGDVEMVEAVCEIQDETSIKDQKDEIKSSDDTEVERPNLKVDSNTTVNSNEAEKCMETAESKMAENENTKHDEPDKDKESKADDKENVKEDETVDKIADEEKHGKNDGGDKIDENVNAKGNEAKDQNQENKEESEEKVKTDTKDESVTEDIVDLLNVRRYGREILAELGWTGDALGRECGEIISPIPIISVAYVHGPDAVIPYKPPKPKRYRKKVKLVAPSNVDEENKETNKELENKEPETLNAPENKTEENMETEVTERTDVSNLTEKNDNDTDMTEANNIEEPSVKSDKNIHDMNTEATDDNSEIPSDSNTQDLNAEAADKIDDTENKPEVLPDKSDANTQHVMTESVDETNETDSKTEDSSKGESSEVAPADNVANASKSDAKESVAEESEYEEITDNEEEEVPDPNIPLRRFNEQQYEWVQQAVNLYATSGIVDELVFSPGFNKLERAQIRSICKKVMLKTELIIKEKYCFLVASRKTEDPEKILRIVRMFGGVTNKYASHPPQKVRW
ncbi:uncharacterized protein LOC141900625 [Tubulanus polymorphus]|uniref:uncharacterized protein LOC141900625 n=1 Tax=Tubulanus polymorphus TaxID=672921 RepID=UPI003DA3A65E